MGESGTLIAKVFDGGATDTGRPYFVMELVKGIPITAYCDANKQKRKHPPRIGQCTMKTETEQPRLTNSTRGDGRFNRQVLIIAIVAAVAGYMAVWLPWHLAGSPKNMVDGMQLISLLYLVLVGFGCGLAVPHRFWVAGLASMSLFPIMAIVGVVRDPTSHNLLGMEFIMYGLLTFPALFGGAVGKVIRALLARCRR